MTTQKAATIFFCSSGNIFGRLSVYPYLVPPGHLFYLFGGGRGWQKIGISARWGQRGERRWLESSDRKLDKFLSGLEYPEDPSVLDIIEEL